MRRAPRVAVGAACRNLVKKSRCGIAPAVRWEGRWHHDTDGSVGVWIGSNLLIF
jgi:hypothetical protein